MREEVKRAITIWGAIWKRSHEPTYKTNTKKCSKEVKSDNFCYHKVERAITLLEAIEKRSHEPTYKTNKKNKQRG